MGVQYESIVQFYFSHSSGLLLQTVIFHLSIMMKPIMTVRKLTIGMFLGVPLIPMVMETAQIVPGLIVRCLRSVYSLPLTGASCTTNAHLLTMMDIPGAIQLMVDGETDRSLCEVEKNELGYWQKDLSDPDN